MSSRLFAFLVVLATGFAAHAAKLEGVTMPDTKMVEGKQLVLNGLGIREATVFKVDVYIAGLYLEKKTSNPEEVIDSKQTKQVFQHFVREVGKDDVTEAWSEGMENNAGGGYAALEDRVATLNGWMADMKVGDKMSYTWVPGTGVVVEVKGQKKGTIPGDDFAKVMWKVWFGPNPPNSGLKKGMLGKG